MGDSLYECPTDELFWVKKKKKSEPKEPPKLPTKIIVYLPEKEEEETEGDQPLRKTEKETTGQWLINNTIDSITALALPSLLIATAYTLGKKAQIGAAGGYLGVLALTSVINLKSTRDRVEPYVLKGAYAVAKAVFSS